MKWDKKKEVGPVASCLCLPSVSNFIFRELLYLSVHPPILQSVYPSFNPSIHPSIFPSIYPSLHPSFLKSIHPSFNLSFNPSILLLVCPSAQKKPHHCPHLNYSGISMTVVPKLHQNREAMCPTLFLYFSCEYILTESSPFLPVAPKETKCCKTHGDFCLFTWSFIHPCLTQSVRLSVSSPVRPLKPQTKVPLRCARFCPLWGHCPASFDFTSKSCKAEQRVSLTTYCPWASGSLFFPWWHKRDSVYIWYNNSVPQDSFLQLYTITVDKRLGTLQPVLQRKRWCKKEQRREGGGRG